MLSHLTNSAIVIYSLQFLKGTAAYRKFCAAMPMADRKVHMLMSAIGAFMTAVGMHGAVAGTSASGWQVTLAIPPLWVMFHALWDWAQQMTLNQLAYAIVLQQKEAAPVITIPVGHEATVTAPIKETP